MRRSAIANPHGTYELTQCPVCNSPDSAEVADRNAMRTEVERVWEFHQQRLYAAIPPRYLLDRVAFSQATPIRLAQCRNCSHLFRNPRERVETLESAYDANAPDGSVLQELFDTQRSAYRHQVARLKQVTGKSGRGLEVGSYVGGFLAAARDAGWAFEGVDVSEAASVFAVRNGFTVTRGTIESVSTQNPYDVVAIWNTFEQLYDSRSAVTAAHRLVRRGGTMVVRIPNGEFYLRWRARLGGSAAGMAERVLVHNNLLSFPYRQGFTEKSLTRLLRGAGFEIERVYGDTLVPVADRWTTLYGALEERAVKAVERLAQRLGQRQWRAPWVEVYARAK
ncbi:MAG: class I SAM-dependent methyltransferase [Gemmatimonadaceae bacterium]